MILQNKKLGQIINLHYGKGIDKFDRRVEGSYPIFGANGELGRTDKFLVEGEAIIVGRKGSAGEVIRISGRFWPSDVTYYVFGNDKINIDYLFFFFKSVNLTQFARGVKPGINRNDVYELEIPLPPLSEQKEIVRVLDEKMGKIAEAKLLREDALADTEKILSQTLAEIFEEGKKKGWEEKIIGKVCAINPTKSEIKSVPDSEKISFVSMSSVDEYSQAIEHQEERKLGLVKKGYTYFKKGDILFAKITPCMENGKIAHTKNLDHKIGFGSTEFHVLRANEEIVLPELIYQVIRSKKFRLEAAQRMTGSAGQKRVPKDFIENYKIILPHISEQQKIVFKLNAVSARIHELRELQTSQLTGLESLERAYLREAFNGELI